MLFLLDRGHPVDNIFEKRNCPKYSRIVKKNLLFFLFYQNVMLYVHDK